MKPVLFYSPAMTGATARIAIGHPPEAGYSQLMPDVWQLEHLDPHSADTETIQTFNTGWPIIESGHAIGTGQTVIERRRVHNTSTAPFGTIQSPPPYRPPVVGRITRPFRALVESGGEGALWCCDWWDLWCDEQDCIEQDKEAAQKWIDESDTPGVIAPPSEAKSALDDLIPQPKNGNGGDSEEEEAIVVTEDEIDPNVYRTTAVAPPRKARVNWLVIALIAGAGVFAYQQIKD